jgi:hypothetical protein
VYKCIGLEATRACCDANALREPVLGVVAPLYYCSAAREVWGPRAVVGLGARCSILGVELRGFARWLAIYGSSWGG